MLDFAEVSISRKAIEIFDPFDQIKRKYNAQQLKFVFSFWLFWSQTCPKLRKIVRF